MTGEGQSNDPFDGVTDAEVEKLLDSTRGPSGRLIVDVWIDGAGDDEQLKAHFTGLLDVLRGEGADLPEHAVGVDGIVSWLERWLVQFRAHAHDQ